jgi:hypothetical protein
MSTHMAETVHRNPVNGYRLFKGSDLEAVLIALKRSANHG